MSTIPIIPFRRLGRMLLRCIAIASILCRAADATVYSLYNIPPFAVTFQTQHTDALETALQQLPDGETLLSETNGRASGLSFPLRSITQTFLYAQFQTKIVALQSQQNAMDPSQQYEWFPMYSRLVGVDLTVQMYLVEGTALQNQARDLSSLVTLRAELNGLLAFQETDSPKPSNEQFAQMFEDWLQQIFSSQRDAYLRDLVQSDQDLLREISSLDIATNIGASSTESTSSSDTTGWSERTQQALLTILILLAIVGLGFATLAMSQGMRKRRVQVQSDANTLDDDELEEDYNFSLERPPPINSTSRSTSMDAVRHGTDVFHRSSYSGAMSVLESTDRYLSKHRPDLYEAGATNNFSVFGRDYTIPSNPFELIYSAFTEPKTFAASPHGAFSAPRRAIPPHTQNIAAMRPFDEEEEMDGDGEEHLEQPWTSQTTGYRPISSIWRNLTNMWDYDSMRPRMDEDGIVNRTPQQSMDMELQTVNFGYEDETYYDFPFKDFPRHDGTPCLIFNDGALLTPKQRELFEIGSPTKDDEMNIPVSDLDFQRMLAQQGDESPDSSMIESPFNDEESNMTDFKEKLGRLMQQKYRQYEKKAIVEKHQERRAKERKSVREQERQERHKAMERQIDDLEAAFSKPLVTDTARDSPKPVRWTSSPNHYSQRYSPKPTAQYSPFRQYSPHRNTAGAPSPFRHSHPSPNLTARPSPTRGLEQNLSFDRESLPYRPSSHSPFKEEVGHASFLSLDDPKPFRMRPRTTNPTHAPTGPNDFLMDTLQPPTQTDQRGNSMDHSTLDKLSMPSMTIDGGNGKYPSPNSVIDDIFGGAPTSITRRKSGSIPKPLHRRVNSLDHKLGFDRPVPQQRRKSKTDKQRTMTPNRDRSIPRSSTPTQRSIPTRPLTPLTGLARGESSLSAQDHSSSSSLSSTRRGGSNHSRSNSLSAEDNVFTHGVVAQSRFV